MWNSGCGTLLAIVAALAFSSAPQNVAWGQEATTEVANGIYSYAPGSGYISMFVVTGEGVIAIEPVNPRHATGLLEAIRRVTDQPVRYLLHSHNHWDHSGGGQVFRDAGATIVAHEDAAEWMAANPHPAMVTPDERWSGERHDIVLGDATVELHHLGLSHGLGMTAFRVADQRVVYVADLVTPNRVLFAIVPDFNMEEWKRALSEIEALDFDVAVFSHNNSGGTTGTKADVTATREYIVDLQSAVAAEYAKGTPMMQIPQAVRLPKYENWVMYEEWLPLNVWRFMLEPHMGPYPWRPESGQ